MPTINSVGSLLACNPEYIICPRKDGNIEITVLLNNTTRLPRRQDAQEVMPASVLAEQLTKQLGITITAGADKRRYGRLIDLITVIADPKIFREVVVPKLLTPLAERQQNIIEGKMPHDPD